MARRLGEGRPGPGRRPEGGQVAPEDDGGEPVHHDAHLPVDGGHGVDVVAAVGGPGGHAAQVVPHDAGDALADAQRGHRSEALVRVGGQLRPAVRAGGEDGDEVVRQDPGLAHRVLGGGSAGGRGVLAGQVRHGGAVPRRPGAVDDDAVAGDLERGQGGDPPAPLDGQVGLGQDRGGLDAGGPHDGVGVEFGAVGEHDVPVDAGVEESGQAHVDAALAQLLQAVAGQLLGQLGQDPARALHQDEVDVLLVDAGDLGDVGADHVLQFRDRLDAGEATSDEDEGQQPAAPLGVPGAGGVVDAREHPVAQRQGLLDLLEAHGLLGQARDGQGAGLRAQGQDEVVIAQVVGLGDLLGGLGHRRGDGDGARGVVDAGDRPGQDGHAVEVAPVGGHDVAGLDGAGGDLRQEGLVGHVGAGVDDGDLDLVGAQARAQPPGGAEADVAAAGDHNADGAPSPGGGGDLRHIAPRGARGQGGERGASREQAGGRQGDGGAAAHAHNLTKETLSPKPSRDPRRRCDPHHTDCAGRRLPP